MFVQKVRCEWSPSRSEEMGVVGGGGRRGRGDASGGGGGGGGEMRAGVHNFLIYTIHW